jgi:hypothetical protein
MTNVTGHYETSALKETPFRQELAAMIFTDLLDDWKNQKLTKPSADYLMKNLLKDAQDLIQELGIFTSRTSMSEQIKQLQVTVKILSKELHDLVANQASVSSLNGSANALSNVGMFKKSDAILPTGIQTQNESVESITGTPLILT